MSIALSSLKSMLGLSSAPRITPQDRAILDMKLQRDKLRQYQKRIQGILDQEQVIARQALAQGNKEKARTALRRRKYQEGLLTRTYAQLETLEQLVSSVEFSQIEVSVIHGLKQGNQVLSEIHKEMSLEAVEKLMGDTQEAVEYQREIDELLTSRMTLDEEEAVQRELAALQKEQLAPVEEPHPRLPEVPITEPIVVSEPIAEERTTESQRNQVALEA